MSNVVHASFSKYNNLTTQDTKNSNCSSGDNGGGGGMLEARVAKLESDVANIKDNIKDIKEDIKSSRIDLSTLKTNVATINSNYATKQDVENIKTELHKTISSQTKWVIASIFVALSVGLTIAKLLL